ncbi:MAG: VPLPA-CTERM sorting domain-containing protein [Proteobacteria bacterium]|nr:VPLPA-CTERM sorting domain-containing protein [Pseudomonadota bacterium]
MKIFPPLLALAMIFVPISASAAVTYTYTGSNFNVFSGSTYDGSMFVSGYIELDDFLAPNLFKENINPTFYSFSDGVNTISKGDHVPGFGGDIFEFDTDDTGTITKWDVTVFRQTLPGSGLGDIEEGIRTENNYRGFVLGGEIIDQGRRGVCTVVESDGCSMFSVSTGEIQGNPGTWSVVPIPAALPLLGSVLLGIAGIGYRRKYRALVYPVVYPKRR